MSDANFKRSVVLLCQHNKEETFGFILNRQLGLSFSNKFSNALPEVAYLNAPIYFGGPVEPDTLHYLHLLGDEIIGSEEVADGVFWGGSYETLKTLLKEEKIKRDQIRFFLGYSGWSASQMDEELEQKSWIVTNAQCSDIFNDSNDENLWANILKDMGGDYKSIANYPENPNWN